MAAEKFNYYKSDYQNSFVADFGFDAPHRTKKPCDNPVFADVNLHRIAIMKKEHLGSPVDRDKYGTPGWTAIRTCTGCGREFGSNVFYLDNEPKKNNH